jgi:hypothetical protein
MRELMREKLLSRFCIRGELAGPEDDMPTNYVCPCIQSLRRARGLVIRVHTHLREID